MAADAGRRLGGVKSWGYQLQHGDPENIAKSPYDLVVVDYSRNGEDDGRFTADEVRKMQTRPDGGRRIVLAYLSIGEAETYRYYWNEDWAEPLKVLAEGDIVEDKADPEKAGKGGAAAKRGGTRTRTLGVPRLSAPVWLGRENFAWAGNFLVRYWEKGWQDIIFGSKDAYLERIIAAGFDGVYLDRVDAFYGVTDERASGKTDMVAFVTALARRARDLKPGFAIVPQNGEELLLEPAYLATIDGIAKEDLLYGNPSEGQPNNPATVSNSVTWLSPALRHGLPVLVVEYLLEKETAERLRADITEKGFIAYFGTRSLDRLILPEDLKPARTAPSVGAPAAKAAPPTAGKAQQSRRTAPAARNAKAGKQR